MSAYQAPVRDMMFNIHYMADLAALSQLPAFIEAGLDADTALETAKTILEEAAKFCENVIAPLNQSADLAPASLNAAHQVTTSQGFQAAYHQYVTGGWQGLQHPMRYGGQGLPKTIGTACMEMLNAANLSFALCPLLTDGAIEALLTAGSEDVKATYLAKLVSGEWTGTMNLTEPQAGSDLAQVHTKALRQSDGTYQIFGTKIFITYGEHDLADNIIHLVLARVQGAPEGVKGLSLFVVPKFLPQKNGTLGARNDVYCAHLEHKLGIKASPTAVLQYGDHGGATGFLVGEENHGLAYMFIMMNAARFAVGVQGIAIADRAYQRATHYARQRIQSRPIDGSSTQSVPIIEHPDVRRLLMTMRACVEGCRAMAYVAASHYDWAHHHPDHEARLNHLALYEFLVPLVKGYSTEMSQTVTALGIQVHGGMGFIEETGAAQHYRDAKILTIYEGTTAIQANDLVVRKTLRDGGKTAKAICAAIEKTEQALLEHVASNKPCTACASVARRLKQAREALLDVIDFVLLHAKSSPNAVFAGSVPYLLLAGQVVTGWQLARALLIAKKELSQAFSQDHAASSAPASQNPQNFSPNLAFMQDKMATAVFYAEHFLNQAGSIKDSIVQGAASALAIPTERL